MRGLRALIETGALMLALVCLAPYVPDKMPHEHQFGAVQIIGTALFAASRALRWEQRRWIALPETAGYAAVAYVLQWSYNML